MVPGIHSRVIPGTVANLPNPNNYGAESPSSSDLRYPFGDPLRLAVAAGCSGIRPAVFATVGVC